MLRHPVLLVLAFVLVAVGYAACAAGGAAERMPRVGDRLPAGTPEAPRLEAPADPADGRHLSLALDVSEERASLHGAPALEEGWSAGYPSGATALRVRLYDQGGRALYEAGLPDPLRVDVYGGDPDVPHGHDRAAMATVPLTLPLPDGAAHLVVARQDRVVLTRDLRRVLRP